MHRLVIVQKKWCQRICASYIHTAQRACGAHFENVVPQRQQFQTRHIGPNHVEKERMLQTLGYKVITRLQCFIDNLFIFCKDLYTSICEGQQILVGNHDHTHLCLCNQILMLVSAF